MPIDIVIDTNVLMHADNDEEPRCNESIDLLNLVSGSEISLCIDEGFNLIESQNQSQIGHEYLKHLRIGMRGYTLVLQLASENRITFITKSVPSPINRSINRTGIKKSDRIFVRVAFNSTDKVLVSHDYEDFTIKIRKILKNEVDVQIVEAGAYCKENIPA